MRGALINEPELPQPNSPITLRLGLLDPNEVPVQDAVVTAGFTRSGQANTSIEMRFNETNGLGIYLSDPVVFPSAGRYRLLLRDQIYRQEESRAELTYEVGGGSPKRSYIFVFPPTATGPQSLTTWLLWLILLPVGSALGVTLWVLLSPTPQKAEKKS